MCSVKGDDLWAVCPGMGMLFGAHEGHLESTVFRLFVSDGSRGSVPPTLGTGKADCRMALPLLRGVFSPRQRPSLQHEASHRLHASGAGLLGAPSDRHVLSWSISLAFSATHERLTFAFSNGPQVCHNTFSRGRCRLRLCGCGSRTRTQAWCMGSGPASCRFLGSCFFVLELRGVEHPPDCILL